MGGRVPKSATSGRMIISPPFFHGDGACWREMVDNGGRGTARRKNRRANVVFVTGLGYPGGGQCRASNGGSRDAGGLSLRQATPATKHRLYNNVTHHVRWQMRW